MAIRGLAYAVSMVASWPLPLNAPTLAAGPGVLVSEKLAEVVAPLALAVILKTPAVRFAVNDGEFTWPVAFLENFPADQLKLVQTQAKTLVKYAEKGNKIDINVLKDMRNEVDKIRDQLFKMVNEIPTTQYLEAKRFLNDFDDARQALERGEALTQVNFQKWCAGGKNLQQLVDYMIANGMKFTPATLGDEFAYRSAYSGMVAMDVALNTQAGGAIPETSEPKEN